MLFSSWRSVSGSSAIVASQQASGYCYALSLPLTEASSLFRTERIETVGQVVDEVGTADMQGMEHFFIGGIKLSKAQVLAYGAAHERISLGNINEIAAVKG